METFNAVGLGMTEPEPDFDQLVVVKANRAANCARGLRSIPRRPIVRNETVAIVGYGPSLAATWRTILLHSNVVWTVSKAHDFLLARGVRPTLHTDVDPREHKAGFIKDFQPGVDYWISSQVHPVYLDKAVSQLAPVRLFHSQVPQGGPYEAGYVKVPAMFDAALQAAKLAYDAGYRKQHWFGIDASFDMDRSHAGPHEGTLVNADDHEVRVGDVVYRSNALLVRQALWAEKMLLGHPKMQVAIHGNGMLGPFLRARRRVAVR